MATILKGTPEPRRLEAAVVAARERARMLVAEAEAEAAALRQAAAEEAGRVRAEAEAAGYAAGEARAAASLLEVAAARSAWDRAQAEEVAALAVEIARRILGEALTADPAAVVALAEEAICRARGLGPVELRVSPADLPVFEAALPRLSALVAPAPGARQGRLPLRADPALGAGALVVEAALGTVDARIEAQLEAVEQALREARP